MTPATSSHTCSTWAQFNWIYKLVNWSESVWTNNLILKLLIFPNLQTINCHFTNKIESFTIHRKLQVNQFVRKQHNQRFQMNWPVSTMNAKQKWKRHHYRESSAYWGVREKEQMCLKSGKNGNYYNLDSEFPKKDN